MKQIYNFENYAPPALNEKTLRREIERRKLRRQMFLLALAAILSQAAIFLMACWPGKADRLLRRAASCIQRYLWWEVL